MIITIVGTDVNSLNLAMGFAELGHSVVCTDDRKERLTQLGKGIISKEEAELELLLLRNLINKRLTFSHDLGFAFNNSDVIYNCICCEKNAVVSKEIKKCIENTWQLCKVLLEFQNKSYKLFVIMGALNQWLNDYLTNVIRDAGINNLDIVFMQNIYRGGQKSIDSIFNAGKISVNTYSNKALKTINDLFNSNNTGYKTEIVNELVI
jgi:UDPglucose 6-dehydrogenase